jgi:high-affinity nickel-transport protein
MSLFDTADGVLMRFAYGWAFLTPARKVYYNVVITAMSVVIALGIGLIELGSVLADALGLDPGAFAWFDRLDLLGYAIVGVLIATWLIAVAVWRLGRFEQRLAPTTP